MATYLPVLLGSVNNIPDDSTLSDLPRGQVDYLSHEWREEDVWRSWRNMTRLKNEIANGVRLENASWRTWWKQRNGLGTVTPETLNWSVLFFRPHSDRRDRRMSLDPSILPFYVAHSFDFEPGDRALRDAHPCTQAQRL
jgi:hypothetical protein